MFTSLNIFDIYFGCPALILCIENINFFKDVILWIILSQTSHF